MRHRPPVERLHVGRPGNGLEVTTAVLSSTLGRGHIRYLLPVPGHGAPLPCLLLRLPLPPDNTGGQQQHCGQGEEAKRLDWIC